MKKVKVTRIEERNGHYEVFLYPSRRVAFTSKAKAEAYLRNESKKLTEQLYLDLEFFRMIQNEYISNYGIFDRRTSLHIEQLFQSVWKVLDMATNRTWLENVVIAGFLNKAEMFMLLILKHMRSAAKSNSNTPLVYSIDRIRNMIGEHEDSDDWRISMSKAG